MNHSLEFWCKALDGIRETDGFQPEHQRKNLSASYRNKQTFALPDTVCSALHRFSKNKPQNLFLILSSGVAAMLSKYSFSQKVVYAAPVLLSQKEQELKNRFVLCVTESTPEMRFTELVRNCGEFYQNALRNQNIAEDILKETLELKESAEKPLVKTLVLMKGLHDETAVSALSQDIAFSFADDRNVIQLSVDYNADLYSKELIAQIAAHLFRFYALAAVEPERKLEDMDVLSADEHSVLRGFQGKEVPLEAHENILSAFRNTVRQFGSKTALVEQEQHITYSELDAYSDRIAGFIRKFCASPQYVGVYMKNGIQHIAAILGTLKAGVAYVPLDYDLPYDRIRSITEDIGLSLIISQKVHIQYLNKLQNECNSMRNYLCLDTDDVYALEEQRGNDLSSRDLWEFVGNRSADSIEGGGWQSSYTGENLSATEMDEYGENVRTKLMPYLSRDRKVLEIGCASGITMFRIAPNVRSYFGTDLAQAILDKDMEIIREKHIDNITLCRKPAIEIDSIPEANFDIIIINSVIQCFNGYNYFRKVLEKLIRLAADRALIFFGDIMDAEKKQDLIASLRDFASKSGGKGYTTKTDWSQELFFSKRYFLDLAADHPEINRIEFSDKIGTIRNELTEFRYDAMLFIDKTASGHGEKMLGQYGKNILESCEYTAPETEITDDTSAYVIYTSGTTGKPKGIEIKAGALMRFCKWNNRFYELTDRDVTTRYARVGFDAAVWELFPPLCAGCEIHVIPEEMRLDLNALNNYFNTNGVTFSFLPTQMFEQFMEQDNRSFRVVATGGDKLSVVRKTPYRIINNYGPTETTIVVTAAEVNETMTSLPIGKPIDNVRIHILDRNGLPQPVGVVGEICIAGPNLAKWYINLPELTAEKFCCGKGCGEERIYHTGDLGRWRPDGNIEFFGRMDGQIKISAFRIEMEEISAALCEMSCISQAAVRTIQDEGNSRFLCAYIVTDSETLTVDEVRRFLQAKLPEYMIPPYIILMDQFPVTPNGKTDYAKLPDPRGRESARDLVNPQNDVEAALLSIFCKTLGTEKIGVTDSFFECGGNSIKAIKLVAELTQSFEVTINDVFTYQSVRALADHINAKEKNLEGKFQLVKEALKTISEADPIALSKDKYEKYLRSAETIQPDLGFDRKKYKAVLFTGATGFLGINLLKRLLCSTDAEIYTIIRGSSAEPAERLMHKWQHQFGGPMPDECRKKLHIFEGDLTGQHFGLSDTDYQMLAEKTDCIINTAANVRHYGHHSEFSDINAELIHRLRAFAQEGTPKELHHVSTIGVAEGVVSNTPFFLFTEDDSDVGQIVNNYYTETKLQAERYIQEARENGVSANIYRVGNLIADSETGVFQENIDTNGFYKTLRAMLILGAVPDTNVRMMDFSCIDQIAESMMRLVFSNDGGNQNYHLFHPQQISTAALSALLHEIGIQAEIVSADAFLDMLYAKYNSETLGDYVKEFILHTRLFSVPDETHFTLLCDRTCAALSKLGFTWKPTDAAFLKKMLDYCKQTGFLPQKKEECVHGTAG